MITIIKRDPNDCEMLENLLYCILLAINNLSVIINVKLTQVNSPVGV